MSRGRSIRILQLFTNHDICMNIVQAILSGTRSIDAAKQIAVTESTFTPWDD